MLRVDVLVQELVEVHVAMNEVLPSVDYEHSDDNLPNEN